MATNYNYFGNLVTNGLVLDLDAAKLDSYPGSGTVWRDISGNNYSGSLINGPTFTGIGKQAAIVFDGVDDCVSAPGSILPIGTADYCVEFWVKRSSIVNNVTQGLITGTDNNAFFLGFGRTYNGADGLRVARSNIADGENCAFSFVVNVWYQVIVIRSSATIYFYINGQQQTTQGSGTSNYSYSSSALSRIGAGGNVPLILEPLNGNIANVKIYNRALSAAEIQQNFNALRGRYGI